MVTVAPLTDIWVYTLIIEEVRECSVLGILLGHPPLYLLILDEAATTCILVEEKEVI